MLWFADDEMPPAVAGLHALVEVADRRHLDLKRRLRAMRCFGLGFNAVASLARVGHAFQFREAIADGGHDKLLCELAILGAGPVTGQFTAATVLKPHRERAVMMPATNPSRMELGEARQ